MRMKNACFHMTSQQPYWRPHTVKRRQCNLVPGSMGGKMRDPGNEVGGNVELFSYANTFLCSNTFAWLRANVSENALLLTIVIVA